MEPAGPPPTTRTSASEVAICEVTPETYRAEASKGQEAPGDAPARLAPTRDHGACRTRREKDEGRRLWRCRIRGRRIRIEDRARVGSRRIVGRWSRPLPGAERHRRASPEHS